MEIELIINLIRDGNWLVMVVPSIVAILIAVWSNYQINKSLKIQTQLSLFEKRQELYISLKKCVSYTYGSLLYREITDEDMNVAKTAFSSVQHLKFLVEEEDLRIVGEIAKSVIFILESLKSIKNRVENERVPLIDILNHSMDGSSDKRKVQEEIDDLDQSIIKIGKDWHNRFIMLINSGDVIDKLFNKYLKIPQTNTLYKCVYYPMM